MHRWKREEKERKRWYYLSCLGACTLEMKYVVHIVQERDEIDVGKKGGERCKNVSG